MPRPPSDYKALHEAADKFEPRLFRATLKALLRVRELVSINDLAMALASKDAKRALALLPLATVKDALAPAGPIVRDAFAKGGRLGANQVTDAMRCAEHREKEKAGGAHPRPVPWPDPPGQRAATSQADGSTG